MTTNNLERATWQAELLTACITSEVVQAVPIQEKRSRIIEEIKTAINWYRRTRQHKYQWWTIELCQVVERSTTINEARNILRQRISAEKASISSTPASNTGVRSPAHQMLEDYIGGR